MNFLQAFALAMRIKAAWDTVKNLPVGASGDLPPFRTDVGKQYWEVGPIPVRRVR